MRVGEQEQEPEFARSWKCQKWVAPATGIEAEIGNNILSPSSLELDVENSEEEIFVYEQVHFLTLNPAHATDSVKPDIRIFLIIKYC